MVTPVETALAFAKLGHGVFPLHGIINGKCTCGDADCGSNSGKHPYGTFVPHGLKDATCDEVVILGWWRRKSELNVGIVTENLLVVDVDPRNRRDQSWRGIVRKHHDPHTWRVLTGGGGQHLIFANPEGVRCGKIARGVDLKGVGGYIVGPGSLHLSGKQYAWAPQCSPEEAPLLVVPEWLVKLRDASGDAPASLTPAERRKCMRDGAADGTRNISFASVAGQLLRAGVEPGVTYDFLTWCNERSQPPEKADVIKRTVLSIWKKERAKRGRKNND
jgi:hypothetical protein